MYRRGLVGEWRTVFTPELIRSYDAALATEIAELGYPPCLP